VLYPDSQSPATVKTGSIKYDAGTQVLTYIIADAGVPITISEQSTPQAFIDIPQSYATLINSLNNYASFDSLQGTVALTYPKELNGQQSAVMNTKGTLMFAHPTNGSLSENQWKNLFNSLEVIT
jgi:hypothetical protein